MAALTYHPDIIDSCPPADAVPAVGPIYRKIAGKTAVPEDFDSDVEAKKTNADHADCECWGCSIWCDEDAVALALDLFPYWKKKHIVVGTPTDQHGVVKHTPSGPQPNHYTFWRAFGIGLPGKFVKYCGPEEGK